MQIENAAKAEKETGRIEAFSDGVFAFAITVLVLDLKVPPIIETSGTTDLLGRLFKEWPMFLAFLTSFGTILIMWINHHRLYTLIKRSTHWLLVFNGLLLLGVTIVPFSTEMIATYMGKDGENLAAEIYSAVFIIISIFFNLLWWYAVSHNLLDDFAKQTAARRITRQYVIGPFLYLVALLLAIKSVSLSLVLNLLLAVYFALPSTILESILGNGQKIDG